MILQLIFIVTVIAAFGVLAWSFSKIFANIKLLKNAYPITNHKERLKRLAIVAFGQTKIFRFPIMGFLHALVFWGFLVITIGSFEMILDGVSGVFFDNNPLNDRVLSLLGPIYTFIIAAGDISAFVIMLFIIIFIFRRIVLNVKRFEGKEMRHKDHKDAAIALLLILILMISLQGMNIGYFGIGNAKDLCFPVSSKLAEIFNLTESSFHNLEIINWWIHILVIFFFMNYLPYSKHFHVFMSLPNVYLSRLTPLTQMTNMESVQNEVKLAMNPDMAYSETSENEEETPIERFGLKDVEDGSWKNYIDSLTCTQCGRCTSVCPANLTGKALSPRKIVLDYRRRMEEKATHLRKEGKTYDDGKSLYGDYISYEELWACTTCNACAQECPVNIDHPSIILEMRRYIFMEESAAPSLINAMSTNIENNGAPWQYPAADRFNWANEILIKGETEPINVPMMAEFADQEQKPEYLFWVGSAGSYDDRAKKISREFVKLLHKAQVSFACLGEEETDTGDAAKRAGNEFLFQMQAAQNIEILNSYNVKKIVTCDPHDYNTLKNEYPELGGKYEVIHHSQLLKNLIDSGKLKISDNYFAEKTITFHDPCYLGRGNNEYQAPRETIAATHANIKEMERCKSRSLCCGAGGVQMFKESEKGNKEIYELRIEDALAVSPDIIATACPFCMTMMIDGLKAKQKENDIAVLDIAEILTRAMNL